VLHGPDDDSRTAAHTALSQPAGPPDGADENQDQSLLMEAGVSYNKQQLHKANYSRNM
jgi:hypothetical protein